LVLVNGKRRHVSALLNINGTVGRGSAAVDMNLIPGIAISRVEVLRDGAAAQYGSDAIAGVINIQLKSADHGGRVSLTYGEYHTTLDDVNKVHGPAARRQRPAHVRSRGRYWNSRFALSPRQHRGRAQGYRRDGGHDCCQSRPAPGFQRVS
jgi:iron complex outermembrane receptor protein